MEFLADYDFTSHHQSGKTNVADAVSRRPDYDCQINALEYSLDVYRSATQYATTRIARARQAHTDSLRRKICTGSLRDKQWWSTIKQAGGQNRNADIPVLTDASGKEFTTNKEKAECLCQHFADKCSLGQNDFAGTFPAVQPRTANKLHFVRFRQSSVRRALKQLDSSKATGPDGIPSRVLKACSSELAYPLAVLFRQSFHMGVQPSSWKTAQVVPIHKKSSKSHAKNYRPISLLPIMSKVMESIVNRHLVNFVEREAVLSVRQFGFRRGLGASDLLTALQYEWNLVTNRGGVAKILAADIAGAFDKVSHSGVLYKAQCYGITGRLLTWLTSYLSDRLIRTVVAGQSSASHRITAGVPQGSILGPTLFLLYTNDAEDSLPPGVHLAVYADDTTMYHLLQARTDIERASATLQTAVDALSNWGSAWKIKFEPTKSQTLTISHHRQRWPLPTLSFDNVPVPESSQMRLLGVTFDQSLSFHSHLRQLAVRARKRLGFLNKASHILDSKARCTVYKGFVRPVLEYCPLVWLGASATSLGQLDSIQRRALNIIGPGAYLPSLPIRRQVSALAYLYKLHCIPGPPLLLQMLPVPSAEAAPLSSTRLQSTHRHPHQLTTSLPVRSRNNILRAFPHSTINDWNSLPADLFSEFPTIKKLQSFKTKAYYFLRSRDWQWATSTL